MTLLDIVILEKEKIKLRKNFERMKMIIEREREFMRV